MPPRAPSTSDPDAAVVDELEAELAALAAERHLVPAAVRERLAPAIPGSRLVGWLAPLVLTLLAGWLRFADLGKPEGNYFDETYYAHDSFNLLNHGVELNETNSGPGYVVHPPLGKWMIAVGEWWFNHGKTVTVDNKVFPASEFSYRFASAVCGTLIVLLVARIGRRMLGSTLLGCFAGFLVAFEGLEFVQSRISMLDIFLCFWVVVALGFLVLDRDDGRRRLLRALERGESARFPGPALGFRWYRLGVFVALGAATAVKWDGVWWLPVFAGLMLAWDAGARRSAGIPAPVRAAALRDGLVSAWGGPTLAGGLVVLFVGSQVPVLKTALEVVLALASYAWLVVLLNWYTTLRFDDRLMRGRWVGLRDIGYNLIGWPTVAAVYLASWTGWFLADDQHAYFRHAKGHGIVGSLKSLLYYHQQAFDFHKDLDSSHPYASGPFEWLLDGRPVAYYYKSPSNGEMGCHVRSCSREVVALGVPAFWWLAGVAIAACAGVWVARRDWRASLVVWGFLASFVWWVKYFDFNGHHKRTMFFFYALPLVPFIALGLALLAGVVLGGPGASERRRWIGGLAVGFYALVVLLWFAFLFPVLDGQTIPLGSWQTRVSSWFVSWV